MHVRQRYAGARVSLLSFLSELELENLNILNYLEILI